MHCHVKEGSIDSKVSLDEYITLLKERGFDGMLITDHDTYKGYRHWKYQMKGKVHDDFVVLKGIEYDTCDGGHILCIKRFDFIEVFNACESAESNARALKLAQKYKKPGIGGSDAHRPNCVGMGYTILPERVTCETELIALIRSKSSVIETGGSLYGKTTKDKMGKADKILTYSFWFYNKAGTIMRKRKRMLNGKIENPVDPIDPIELKYM